MEPGSLSTRADHGRRAAAVRRWGAAGSDGRGRAAINRRIDSFVRNPQRIAPVEVKLRGQERVLAIGSRDLLTVTAQDADDNLTTVPQLAQSWKAELDEALGAIRAEHQTFWNQISLSIVHSTQNLIRQTAALVPRLISTLLVFVLAFFGARGARAAVRPVLRRSRRCQHAAARSHADLLQGLGPGLDYRAGHAGDQSRHAGRRPGRDHDRARVCAEGSALQLRLRFPHPDHSSIRPGRPDRRARVRGDGGEDRAARHARAHL